MITLNSFFIFSEEPQKLKDFYKAIFEKDPEMADGGYYGFVIGPSVMLMIGPHDKVKGTNQNPERIMVNFTAEDVNSEFKRISETGAKVIAAPYHPSEDNNATIATFADPDGNYLQINSPWEGNS